MQTVQSAYSADDVLSMRESVTVLLSKAEVDYNGFTGEARAKITLPDPYLVEHNLQTYVNARISARSLRLKAENHQATVDTEYARLRAEYERPAKKWWSLW